MTSTIAPAGGSVPLVARLQDRDPGLPVLALVIGAITLARLIALVVSPSDLGFDEAQYWAWSKDFAFGYFTKPPLVAWVIALETGICGDGAACVRAASPLFHGATAFVLAMLARRLYGRATGFWTGIFYVILPGVSVSSFLMTTDVMLMFFWAVALLSFFVYLERPSIGWALVFGIAAGLGLNAKYAMIYLPAMIAVAAIVLPEIRAKVLRWPALLALVVMLAFIAPNVWWNATNGFATYTHTGDNIGWSLSRLNYKDGFEFFGAQFGVAGPVVFGAMLNALLLGARSERPDTDRLLLWLSWPVVIAITLQGFLSNANANWGATAYPAGVIVATALVIRHRWRFFFRANLIFCGIVALGALAATAALNPMAASGPAKQFRQLGGWSETGQGLEAVAREQNATRLVIGGRTLTAGLLHALRNSPLSIRAFLPAGRAPADQFQLDRPWSPGDTTDGTLLFGFDERSARKLGAKPVATIDAPIYSAPDGKMIVYGVGNEQ